MDTQLKKLARQLRDEGIAPERDLLPAIWRAIDRQEAPAAPGGTWLRRFGSNWQLAAVAATLVVLVGVGYLRPVVSDPGPKAELAAWDRTDRALLRDVNQSISDLAAAQAQEPDNLNLTRLSLLAHRSRSNLLRLGTRH